MKYITQTDLEIYIRPSLLDKLIGGSDTKLDRVESQAMGTFRKYIGKRYDVDAIYSIQEDENGNDIRDPFVIKLLCHIMIYTLYSPCAPHDIPEHRKFDYQETMEFLREVGRGDNDCDFKLKEVDVTDDLISEIKINSYPKINHRY